MYFYYIILLNFGSLNFLVSNYVKLLLTEKKNSQHAFNS